MKTPEMIRSEHTMASPSTLGALKKTLFVLTLTLCCQLQAQNPPHYVNRIGGGLETYVSGCGLGAFYSPYISVTNGKNTFMVGPAIQKRSLTCGGAKVGFSRNLTGSPCNSVDDGFCFDLLQLNYFFYAQYTENLGLSYNAAKDELIRKSESLSNWNNVKLNTAQMSSGIELQVNLTKNLSWKSQIGANVYYHLNEVNGLNLEKVAPVISVGTSISFFIR